MIFGQPNFNQFCLGVSLVVWLFAGLPRSVGAHEYEDGFIERSLTITIRDGVGYGEYQIGLNGKTAKQIIELAEQQRQPQEIVPQQLQEMKVTPRALSTPEKSTQALIGEKKDVDSGVPIEAALKDSYPTQDSVKASVPLPVGEHLTDLATIKRFGELRQHWFENRLVLTGDGAPVGLSKISVEPAARHPFSVLVKFQFLLGAKKTSEKTKELQRPTETGAAGDGVTVVGEDSAAAVTGTNPPSKRVIEFRVADRLFADYHGATRYALRARGATMLLQSSVAPVLVRSERVEIDRNEKMQAKAGAAIRAKIAVGRR